MIICLALICLLSAAGPGMAATLDAIDLGTLGGNRSYATAINNIGQVAGWSDTTNGVRHGFSWTPAGGMIEIGAPNDDGVSPTHVLDSGQVIGTYERLDENFGIRFTRVFSWTATGGMVDIGILPGNFFTRVVAVSSNGQVVGNCCSDTQARNCRAFSWTSATGMIDLGTIGGASGAYATAVNENGVVVGYTSSYQAFAWTASGGMVGLGRLPLPNYNYSTADQVNSAGMIVGTSGELYSSTQRRGFIWTTNGGMTDVGHLGGGWSLAKFVSSNGTVVGTSAIGFGLGRAFAWTANGGITNMGALGGFDSGPVGMNKNGLVMGVATGNAGNGGQWQYAFAWTASNGIQALTLGGNSFPRAISEGGHILASGFTSPTGVPRGILWSEANGITVLLPLPRASGGNLEVVAVNSRGQVVGVSYPANWEHALLWQQPPPPRAVSPTIAAGQFSVSVSTVAGKTYVLEANSDLNSTGWLLAAQIEGDGSVKTLTHTNPSGSSQFYRLRVE